MEMYLALISDSSKFSDAADYPVTIDSPVPFAAPDGMEWVEGRPPEGATLYVRLPLIDRLKSILFTLSDDIQAEFGEVAAAIDLALRNDKPEVAKAELIALSIPSELEPVRQSMLGEFDNG